MNPYVNVVFYETQIKNLRLNDWYDQIYFKAILLF